jgi:hypothetical protein
MNDTTNITATKVKELCFLGKQFDDLRTQYDTITKNLLENENLPFLEIRKQYQSILDDTNTIFTYLPHYSLENPEHIEDIIKNIDVKNGRHYALKIPSDFEYKDNNDFYVSSLTKIIEGSEYLRIIASNDSVYGLLYNDSQLIDLVINKLLENPKFTLQIILLQPLIAGQTPDNFLKKLKEKCVKEELQKQIAIYKLYEDEDFKKTLNTEKWNILNLVRLVETDKGCKITLRSKGKNKCSVFLYKDSTYLLKENKDTDSKNQYIDTVKIGESSKSITLDKEIYDYIGSIKSQVGKWIGEISCSTNNIFTNLSDKQKINTKIKLDLFATGDAEIKLGNATERLESAVREVKSAVDGLRVDMRFYQLANDIKNAIYSNNHNRAYDDISTFQEQISEINKEESARDYQRLILILTDLQNRYHEKFLKIQAKEFPKSQNTNTDQHNE